MVRILSLLPVMAACMLACVTPAPVPTHELVHLSGDQMFAPVASTHPFRRLLVSWNVDCPPGAGFEVFLRVERNATWSPWLFLDEWGSVAASPESTREFRVTDCAGGRIAVDEFAGETDFVRAQVKCVTRGGAVARRVTLCFSGAANGRMSVSAGAPEEPLPIALDLPSFSQEAAGPYLGPRICSPTSLAMVLRYHGADAVPSAVAARAYDALHDIYGNWPRSIQAAWSFGVAGYLARFDSWEPIETALARGEPVIISIKVEPRGLTGAPYVFTPGHLVVVVGFDAAGDVIVHDPAAHGAAGVRRVYSRTELGRAWFGHGGVAYVLLVPTPGKFFDAQRSPRP